MSRRILLRGCLLLVPAMVLRFWNLRGLGLTHFDEGSYSMAGQWIASLGLAGAPPQAGHAPALYPLLVGTAFLLFGTEDFVAIAVSGTAGALTVILIWWIGRCWFDETVAAGAAILLGTCEYHLIYSRMALTDATFTLLLWAALALLFRGLERGHSALLGMAGICCGLAWNTKYHGFLPVAIAVAFCLAGLASRRRETQRIARSAGRLIVPAAVALVMMLPWLIAVGATTGWGPVLAGLWDHSVGAGFVPPTPARTLLFYLHAWVALPVLLLSLVGIVVLIRRGRPADLFLAISALCLGLAPLGYTSFPRLLLPLVPGLCLLAAVGAVTALGTLRPLPLSRSAPLLFLGMGLWSVAEALPVLRLRTDSYREAAGFISSQELPVLSQLSKNYYFYDRGRSVEMRWLTPAALEDLVATRPQWILAVDPVLRKLQPQREWLERHRKDLVPLRTVPIRAYEVVDYQGVRRPWSIRPFGTGGARNRAAALIEVFRLRSSSD